jgi:hypothetical protein
MVQELSSNEKATLNIAEDNFAKEITKAKDIGEPTLVTTLGINMCSGSQDGAC